MPMNGSVLGGETVTIVDEDLLLDAGDTLPGPWATQTTAAAGSPVLAYVANAVGGEFELTHDSQSEAQNLTLFLGDDLYIDPTKEPVFECRLKLDHDGATTHFTADQRLVFGLAAARNATLDSNATHCWFRIEGANNNVLIEGDDGTDDTDDVDTGIDYTDSTFHTYVIDMTDLHAVRFMVDGVQATTTIDVAGLSGSDGLQPYIEIQRDAGVEEDSCVIDYVKVRMTR